MKYFEVLKYFKKNKICPFCKETDPHIIYENKNMYIIPARAPYVEDHLLIIPKRHVVFLQELNNEELIDLHELINIRTIKLHTRHEAVNVLLRDGLAEGKTKKSINHLHFHLIPDCPVGAEEGNSQKRKFFDEKSYRNMAETIKQTYN